MPGMAKGAGASDDDARAAEDAALASALGVKNVKRNSKDLVEAAFDGDLDEVTCAHMWTPRPVPV